MSNVFEKVIEHKISRRAFIKASAVIGSAVTASGLLLSNTEAIAGDYGERNPDSLTGVKYRRSGCWGCAFGCGIQVRIESLGGIETATKIEGNPYDPVTNDDYTGSGPEVTPNDVAEPHKTPGRQCAKGQSMLKELYDPYRILTPLKRVGKRGEGKWQAISWWQAINEICNGGSLVGPNGNPYNFDGLSQIKGDGSAMGYGHPDIHPNFRTSEDPGAQVIQAHSKGQRIMWYDGRNQQGTQGRLLDRLGATRYYHDSICNGNYKACWGKALGAYTHRPDYQTNAPFTFGIFAGSNPFEAEQALNYTGRKLTDLLANGTKIVVVDPRLSTTAAKANIWASLNPGCRWLRVKPGGDGALALAMIRRWMNQDYIYSGAPSTVDYLKRPRVVSPYLNYTNATFLVKEDAAKPYGAVTTRVIREDNGQVDDAADVDAAKLEPSQEEINTASTADGVTYLGTVFQLLKSRVTSLTDTQIEAATGLAIDDINQLADEFWMADRPVAYAYRGVVQNSQGYYAIQAWLLLNILRDRVDRPGGLVFQDNKFGLSSAPSAGSAPSGKRSEMYAGSYYKTGTLTDDDVSNFKAFLASNPPLRAWFYAYKQPEQDIIPRESIGYPWRIRAHIFYVSNPAYTTCAGKTDVSEAMKKADGDAYYVPLYVSITTSMNETAELCDYILPDTSWAERWSAPTSGYGGPLVKRGTLRRPVVGSYVGVTIRDADGSNPRSTYWYKGPYSGIAPGTYDGVQGIATAISGPQTMEDILILIGRRLRELGDPHMVNFGYQGISSTEHCDSSYDLFQKMLKGSAMLNGATFSSLKEDVLDYVDADNGMDPTVPMGWGSSDARYYLWMGGRRQNARPDTQNGLANLVELGGLYVKNRNSQTLKKIWIDTYEGKRHNYISSAYWDQLPPVTESGGSLDIAKPVVSVSGTDINALDEAAGYTFTVSHNKLAYHVQSRSSSNEWLRELQPVNYVLIARSDANALGVNDGDQVKIEANFSVNTDGTGEKAYVIGTVMVSDSLRPGVVHMNHHFGRWAMGSKSFTVNGSASTNGLISGPTYDSQGNFTGGTRGPNFDGQLDLSAGTAVNPVGRRDPYNEGKGGGGVTVHSGGQVQYGWKVKVTKL